MSIERYSRLKEQYYSIKEELLSFVKPTCIHKEFKYYDKIRIYDYEKRYEKNRNSEEVVWENCYWDYERDREVWFIDIINKKAPVYFYYLFYDFKERSFHTPILNFNKNEYKDLEIVEIDELVTFGEDICELYSVSFVKKILNALKSGAIIENE